LPEIRGRSVDLGTSTTTGLAADHALVAPAASVAVTTALRVWPASLASTAYVFALAPAIAPQPLPSAAQRSHWYVKLALVFQVPSVVASALPTAATPERVGPLVAAGNIATVPVGPDWT
jgi:hypothetical protein